MNRKDWLYIMGFLFIIFASIIPINILGYGWTTLFEYLRWWVNQIYFEWGVI